MILKTKDILKLTQSYSHHMLAFETFLKNRDRKGGNVKSLKPVKKIIYQYNSWVIDSKTIQDYDSDISAKYGTIQNWLSMPLSTSNPEILNLPDFRTSPAQPNPYLEVYGVLNTKKSKESKESVLTLSIGKKLNSIEYSFNVSTGDILKKQSEVTVKLEKKNYKIDGNYIFDLYVKSGIIDSDGMIDSKKFDETMMKLLDYAKKRRLDNAPVGKLTFSVFLIPSKEIISYESKKLVKQESKSFKDSFGNDSEQYAASSTKTAKFLSFDDKAFTLNCKQGSEFYEDLGIGASSMDKIYFPNEQTINIAGMNWVFTDLSSNHFKFIETRRGIFSQLYENYKNMLQSNPTREQKSVLKTICYKQTQAKQEILIDENLTMDKMRRLFANIHKSDIPFHGFEILILSGIIPDSSFDNRCLNCCFRRICPTGSLNIDD